MLNLLASLKENLDILLVEFEKFSHFKFTQKISENYPETGRNIRTLIMDSCLTTLNAQSFYPLLETFKNPQIFFCGLYTQFEFHTLSKLFNIPSRYKFTLEKNLKSKIKHFSISKDADKIKALLSFIKQHIEGLGRVKGELNFVKEISFKNLFPLALLSDSKRDRDRLTEGLFKIGIKVEHISDLEKKNFSLKNSPNGNKSSIIEKDDSSMVAFLGNTQQKLDGLGFNMVFVLNFPRSPEHLLELISFGNIKHHLFFSDKDFLKKRAGFLKDFLEPACLLRTFKMMKRLSNVANLGSNKFLKIQGMMVQEENGKMQEENEKKDDLKFFEVLKLRKSVVSKMLNCSKIEPFTWIVNKLKERDNFSLAGKCPHTLSISFKIPNIKKSENLIIKEIVKNSTEKSGKYFLNLLKLAGDLDLDTIKMMNNNKIMTRSGLMLKVMESSNIALDRIISLKERGILGFEITDELIFLRPKEALTDVEIYQIIAERRQSELNSLQRVKKNISNFFFSSLTFCTQFSKAIH